MREIRTSGSEGGVAQANAPSLPLSPFSRECLFESAQHGQPMGMAALRSRRRESQRHFAPVEFTGPNGQTPKPVAQALSRGLAATRREFAAARAMQCPLNRPATAAS
jgi:hypothetical protein